MREACPETFDIGYACQMDPDDILQFWFGTLDAEGLADKEHVQRWWRKDPAFDREIGARFGDLHQRLMDGELAPWLDAPRSLLAHVVTLDQFSRNMFRDSARAFAADPLALAAAERGIERGDDRQLRGHERVFLYMPLMHSEDVGAQQRCLQLFTRFRDETSGALRAALDGNVNFAQRHLDIVARFGRFPHRNALLGRSSTPEELAFLEQPGSSF